VALEKSIIKRPNAENSTFDYKPRELSIGTSKSARSFVNEDAFISTDFQISELVAQQAGISQLEDDAQQDKINSQVLERLKEVQENAYQQGYDLGLIEGTEKAFQESKESLLNQMKSMEDLLKRVEDLKTHLLVDNEKALVTFVYQIAKRIALRDLEENRDAVWEILQHVVNEFQNDERMSVRISQEDLAFLETLQQKSGKKIESLKRINFIADDSIKSGGCMIDTEYGNVDASLEERVERTWQTLQGRMPHKPQEKKD
jgi:flagellar assembly protein FliH